jgi:peptidoglycan/LPS O-acetylase OafA/YrhL
MKVPTNAESEAETGAISRTAPAEATRPGAKIGWRARVPLLSKLLYPPRTLGAALAERQDNFLLLRLIASSMVLFGHSYVLSGSPGPGDFVARANLGPGIYTGSLAVDVFFIISGFLIAGSYVNHGNLESFVRARFLRLMPAYAVCMIVSALVFGPLLSTLGVRAYFRDPTTYSYITRNLRLAADLQWSLPGVFAKNPYTGVWNGSIWSLPAEVNMYLWVAVLGLATVLKRRILATVILAGCLVLGQTFPAELPFVPIGVFVRPAAFFTAGMLCYVQRDAIPVRTEIFLTLIVACVVTHQVPALRAAFDFVFAPALVYGVMWFAYRPRLGFYNRFGDYSYGVYLWGFPMQQLVTSAFGRPISPLLNLSLAYPLTLILAFASWHLVEKRTLRWRGRARTFEPPVVLRAATRPGG